MTPWEQRSEDINAAKKKDKINGIYRDLKYRRYYQPSLEKEKERKRDGLLQHWLLATYSNYSLFIRDPGEYGIW